MTGSASQSACNGWKRLQTRNEKHKQYSSKEGLQNDLLKSLHSRYKHDFDCDQYGEKYSETGENQR